MLRSLFVIVLCASAALACSGNYEPWFGGQCYRRVDILPGKQALAECQRDGGNLISIHSPEDNERLRKIVANFTNSYIFIGLQCDYATGKYSWTDGTPFDYANRVKSPCKTVPGSMYIFRPDDGAWFVTADDSSYGLACKGKSNNDVCGDFDVVDNSKTCVSVRKEAKTWTEAEAQCQKDSSHLLSLHDSKANAYAAKQATTAGLSGVQIGLQSNASRQQFSWSDATLVDFKNYASGFPNDIFGHCTALETGTPLPGQWISTQCDSSPLAYACGRPQYDLNDPLAPAGCPSNPHFYSDGHDIPFYSPGYPGAPGPMTCEYTLEVEDGKHVTMRFSDLELNSGYDRVEVFVGTSNTPTATLTGRLQPEQATFTTTKANILRVKLTATDGRLVRGFAGSFHPVHICAEGQGEC